MQENILNLLQFWSNLSRSLGIHLFLIAETRFIINVLGTIRSSDAIFSSVFPISSSSMKSISLTGLYSFLINNIFKFKNKVQFELINISYRNISFILALAYINETKSIAEQQLRFYLPYLATESDHKSIMDW